MIPVYQSFEELRALERPIHWAMGFFDGVHSGHRRVMRSADTPGALRGVLTFEQHPLALLRPEAQPLLLTPDPEQKVQLIAGEGGADFLLRLPFTPELAACTPEAFLHKLAACCCICGVSVGANWRFGRGGSGTVSLLQQLGQQLGFRVCVSELALSRGEPVSSSRIRAAVAAGQLDTARELLGHSFDLTGEVKPGQRLARQLGFPTANISPYPHAALPPYGVYRARCHVGGELRDGIANLGLRPTVCEGAAAPLLEVHFPHWQGDLYGHRLSVELLSFIRPEQKFDDLDGLKQRIEEDIRALSAS